MDSTENTTVQSEKSQILFDINSIDAFKKSFESISNNRKATTVTSQHSDEKLHDTIARQSNETDYSKEEDTKSISSASYRALPTSLDDQSDTTTISFVEHDEPIKVPLIAMESLIVNLGIIQQRSCETMAKNNTKEYKRKGDSYSSESSIDAEDIYHTANIMDSYQDLNLKSVPVNNLGPREQEKADEPIRKGMKYLFENKFIKAKAIFQTKSDSDPLYSLGLGSMTFMKAMMTFNQDDIQAAMDILTITFNISQSQIDNATIKKSSYYKNSFTSYFSLFSTSYQTSLPISPSISGSTFETTSTREGPKFIPNGVLRANVVKAECCLLMGILQMTQESVVGYLKCGLNIKRAYSCYTLVWQEYKRMGQQFTRYMDRDTISAVQLGIGTVHLLLSSLPSKILKVLSVLGFKSDKQLGFALLKLCLEGRGIRSPLASLVLLSYYSILSSFAPQLYAKELTGPAIECLLDAQKNYPSSCFFLYYAARISRIAHNLPLSTQSFTFAIDSSRTSSDAWIEDAMTQVGNYEIGFNFALSLDWQSAATYFEKLSQDKQYGSPAYCQYFVGACRHMLGKQTESILAFAQVPQLISEQQERKKSCIDKYVEQKVQIFQKSGYQNMDFCLPGLELLLVWNVFDQMEKHVLEACLMIVQNTLELIYEREKLEYNIRLTELVPNSRPPNYYDQRAVLLLIKASLLNALKRYDDSISHLNWIMDNKHLLESENWVIPFSYWEAGVTSWGLGNYAKSRTLWELALGYTKYTFEYRMAVRLSLALSKCDEVGVAATQKTKKKEAGISSNGRKRMPIVPY